ncbi:hypothetical protein MAR_018643, partial [Mya arenaria]
MMTSDQQKVKNVRFINGDYLKHLGHRTIYCDSDSVVFTSSQRQWEPPLGDYLGELTDEVPDMVTGKGSECVTVVDEHKIARNPSTGHLITERESKEYKIVFDKRIIGEEYNTF